MISFGPSVCAGGDNDDVVLPSGDGLSSGLLGSEMRGVAFVDPTDTNDFARQVYALQRVPPALVGFDVAQNESYATTAIPTSVSETCSSPTFLYQYPSSQNGVTTATADNPLRLYVNCFDTGEVYIFDPIGPTLLTTLQVGRGPAGMVFDGAHAVAYVLNFTQNDVSVVDLAPGSPTQYHVVQRLGFPTVTPR
jgi:DNA-binding beta-propeller fold protein YncE